MPFNWKNFLFRSYLQLAYSAVFTREKSLRHQQKILKTILDQLAKTKLGADLQLSSIKRYIDFNSRIPLTDYTFYKPYIEKIIAGEQRVMTVRPVKWLAKSSGTTSGESKLIPITEQIMRQCHVRGSFFALAVLHRYNHHLQLLSHKSLLFPGGIYETLKSGIIVGDISGILVNKVPAIYRSYYTPSIETQTTADWQKKITTTVQQIAKEDVGTISGVPTWILSVLQKMQIEFPFNRLTDIWKNLQVYFHGGVSFEPYRQQFEKLVGKKNFVFYEIYNATEGFFGIQENLESNNLLLLTDNFIFYEFVPLSEFGGQHAKAIPLYEVQTTIPYVLLITAPNGLIRYVIGDVITFNNLNPFTFKITGRTQEYINAFGEDLLLSHVQNALLKTGQQFECTITDYTVAPLYMNIQQKGRIQVAIEFSSAPNQLADYEKLLDQYLQQENSNYQQKRTHGLALDNLEVISLSPGTFYKWLAARNKLGGQHKVPRLVNGRKVIEEILLISSSA